MQEIKNCQFCGSDDQKVVSFSSSTNSPVAEYYVICDNCGAQGPIAVNSEVAIQEWNSRIQEVPEIAKEEQVSCPCNGNEEDYHYCPIMDKSCIKDNCMMFVWTETERDGTEWGRCGLVNTMYINSTGCGS